MVATSGEEAINLALSKNIDLILMDIQMPGMDGYTAAKNLRDKNFRKPIIALTAHAMEEDIKKSLAYGCDAHASKPIQFDELINLILRLVKIS